jgi:tetratricopeptide (TPR) repeat protein
MNRLIALLLGLALPFFAGCKPGPKDITPLQRKQAASLASEADFALTLKDFARAEGLYQQATGLCPDVPQYWENLGVTRRRLNDLNGARAAYRQALAVHEDRYRQARNPADLLQQAWLLALLGRDDDAATLMRKTISLYPDDARVRQASDPKWLERMHNDPTFKAIAL